MVYDADGGLVGEARYVLGHLLGRAECSLCDITHGRVAQKADFAALVDALERDGHQVRVVHRNEQTQAESAASAGALPCVLRSDDGVAGPWTVVIGRKDLEGCGGDVGAFARVLGEALAPDARPPTA
jgi:hypothetical protein